MDSTRSNAWQNGWNRRYSGPVTDIAAGVAIKPGGVPFYTRMPLFRNVSNSRRPMVEFLHAHSAWVSGFVVAYPSQSDGEAGRVARDSGEAERSFRKQAGKCGPHAGASEPGTYMRIGPGASAGRRMMGTGETHVTEIPLVYGPHDEAAPLALPGVHAGR